MLTMRSLHLRGSGETSMFSDVVSQPTLYLVPFRHVASTEGGEGSGLPLVPKKKLYFQDYFSLIKLRDLHLRSLFFKLFAM